MIYKTAQYSRLKTRLKKKYQSELKLTIKALKKKESLIADWLHDHSSELNQYSDLHWFFLEELKSFLFFQTEGASLKPDFGPREEMVFERWNNSEFADVLLKKLNSGNSLAKASAATLAVFDKHLVALGERHILRSNTSLKNYRPQSSLGDVVQGKKVSKLLETTLHLEGKELRLMTSTMKEMKEFSSRIDRALKVIKRFSPTSWERFEAFTDVIIPISQQEFVSYSHQNLPGYSMINLYHRDFVDLMDDLLHENGHHHLNYYLNLGKLIDEPVDNIYYSPWRRTPRPLRGVYHAYFTFFWAFKLFADLSRAKDVDSIWYLFGPKEKEKIIWRAVEEFHMLNYTYKELKWAYKNGLIKEAGWKLIEEQQKEIGRLKRVIPAWEKKLKLHKKELKDLKQTLKEAERDFTKN